MAQRKVLIDAPNGRKIPAWVMHPDSMDVNSTDSILVIALHGVGENGKEKDSTNWLDYLRSNGSQMLYNSVQQPIRGRNFILVAPQLYGGDQADPTENRNSCWPTWYIKETLYWAYKNLKFDPQRVCGTGLSLGGGGMLNFVTQKEEYGKMFSAICFCCPVGVDDGYDNIVKAKLPCVFYHAQDDWVGFKNSWNVVMAVNNNANVSIHAKGKFPLWGGHGIWDIAYNPYGDPFGNGVSMWDFFILNKFLSPVEMPDVDKPSGVIIQPPGTQSTTTLPATTVPVTTQPATTQPVGTTNQPGSTQPVTTQPGTTTNRPATTQAPTTTQPASTTAMEGPFLTLANAEMQMPPGTGTFILDVARSGGWQTFWWSKISGPNGIFMAPPGNANGAPDYGTTKWQVYGAKDGEYVFEGRALDKYNRSAAVRVKVKIGVVPVEPAKPAYWLALKVYSDGRIDPAVQVPLDKVSL